ARAALALHDALPSSSSSGATGGGATARPPVIAVSDVLAGDEGDPGAGDAPVPPSGPPAVRGASSPAGGDELTSMVSPSDGGAVSWARAGPATSPATSAPAPPSPMNDVRTDMGTTSHTTWNESLTPHERSLIWAAQRPCPTRS